MPVGTQNAPHQCTSSSLCGTEGAREEEVDWCSVLSVPVWHLFGTGVEIFIIVGQSVGGLICPGRWQFYCILVLKVRNNKADCACFIYNHLVNYQRFFFMAKLKARPSYGLRSLWKCNHFFPKHQSAWWCCWIEHEHWQVWKWYNIS